MRYMFLSMQRRNFTQMFLQFYDYETGQIVELEDPYHWLPYAKVTLTRDEIISRFLVSKEIMPAIGETETSLDPITGDFISYVRIYSETRGHLKRIIQKPTRRRKQKTRVQRRKIYHTDDENEYLISDTGESPRQQNVKSRQIIETVQSFTVENKIKYSETTEFEIPFDDIYAIDSGLIPGINYTFEEQTCVRTRIKSCPVCNTSNTSYYIFKTGIDGRNHLVYQCCGNDECAAVTFVAPRYLQITQSDIPPFKMRYRIKDLCERSSIAYGYNELETYETTEIIPVRVDLIPTVDHGVYCDERPDYNRFIDLFYGNIGAPSDGIDTVVGWALDIETIAPLVIDNEFIDDAPNEIICMCFVHSDGRKVSFMCPRFIFGKDVGEFANTDESTLGEVHYYETEPEMVEAALLFMKSLHSLIFTYNGDEFDLRYIYNRVNGILSPLISDDAKTAIIKIIDWSIKPIFTSNKNNLDQYIADDEPGAAVRRRRSRSRRGQHVYAIESSIHIDLYQFFKLKACRNYIFTGRYTRLGLGAVSKSFLGMGKLSDDIPKRMSQYGKYEMLTYCIHDAFLTISLANMNENYVMMIIQSMMRISFFDMFNITRNEAAIWIKRMTYVIHRKFHYFINRPEVIIGTMTSFEGAIVFDPVPGIMFRSATMDFASEYPSIKFYHNLSYETVNVCMGENCRYWDERINCNQGTNCPHCDRHEDVPELGCFICKGREGIQSSMIGAVKNIRVTIFKPLAQTTEDRHMRMVYKGDESGLKVYVNTEYGTAAYHNFPFYRLEVAACTTHFGRQNMTELKGMISDNNGLTYMGDTDSAAAVGLDQNAYDRIIQRWEENGMQLDVETPFLFAISTRGKKNYLSWYDSAGYALERKWHKIRGAGSRHDLPVIVSNGLMDMIHLVDSFCDGTNEELQISAPEHIPQMFEKINRLFVDLGERISTSNDNNDFIHSVKLSVEPDDYETVPMHVRIARRINARIQEIVDSGLESPMELLEAGSTLSIIKTIPEHSGGVSAIDLCELDYFDTIVIDVKSYISSLITVFEPYLIACKYFYYSRGGEIVRDELFNNWYDTIVYGLTIRDHIRRWNSLACERIPRSIDNLTISDFF